MHVAHVETFLASLKRCLAVPGFLEDFYREFLDSSDEVREKFTMRKRPARKAARPAGPPAHVGSWRTAATELEAARRHLRVASLLLERLRAVLAPETPA